MSVARPAARRLLSGRLAAGPGGAAACAAPATATCHQLGFAHQFHSSPQLSARRRPRFANVRAADMGLMDEKQIDQFTKDQFPKYTKEEIEHLRTKYSPAQIAALEAGEAAIDPRDLTVQGRLRVDPYTMPYIDDFAETQPIIDKRAKNKEAPDPLARFMNLDEFTEDLIQWADKFQGGEVTGTLKTPVDFVSDEFKKVPEGQWPGEVREAAHKAFQSYLEAEVNKQASKKDPDDTAGPTDADILQYILERSGMTDNNRTTNTSLAHALPSKVPGVAGMYKNAIDPEDEGLDDIGIYQDLKRRTGLKVKEILNLHSKQLVQRRVANQTRLGKVQKTAIMYVVGNGDGWLGIGEAKSTEPSIAGLKARLLAIRNMRPIRRYEQRTIYGSVTAKVSGTIVKMNARPPGFGLRVSHRIFEMCRAAGIQDLAANIPRSRNPMNTVKAAYWALCNQPDPEQMAIGRGKKMVDVRKVYYGGSML
ncbi:ribosomal protein S5, C-terminal domain-containing protein [Chaetomium sp. MPI-CAGE-AT-0009]|nr:ribosomal protein S5, C-terminal domain-containing protein [Chaetomium sp. MPI-CAGE-AT-0009]